MEKWHSGRPQTRFIDSVKQPVRLTGFEVHDERIRHRQIGDLYREYVRRHPTSYPNLALASSSFSKVANKLDNITFVPPLRLLDARTEQLLPLAGLSGRTQYHLLNVKESLDKSLSRFKRSALGYLTAMGAFIAAWGIKFKPTNLSWFPKKYSLNYGLKINRKKASELFLMWGVLPAMLLGGVLLLVLLDQPPLISPKRHYSQVQKSSSQGITLPAGRQGSSTLSGPAYTDNDLNHLSVPTTSSASSSLNSPAAISTKSSPSSRGAAPSSSPPTTTGSTGGQGGGSTPPSSSISTSGSSPTTSQYPSSGTSSSGNPLQLTTTVPGTNVQAIGKNIISSSPTNVTVN